jgi:hypothetical protein
MTDQSDQPSHEHEQGPSPKSFGESVRAKLDEYEVERHLNELAGSLEHAVRQGVAKAGELAHEHKGDIERLFDKAAGAVDRRTDGRHADKISQVRGSLERGVDRIAEHRPGGPTDEAPGSDVPPSNG